MKGDTEAGDKGMAARRRSTARKISGFLLIGFLVVCGSVVMNNYRAIGDIPTSRMGTAIMSMQATGVYSVVCLIGAAAQLLVGRWPHAGLAIALAAAAPAICWQFIMYVKTL